MKSKVVMGNDFELTSNSPDDPRFKKMGFYLSSAK